MTTQSATDAGALAVWLARPIQGFYFPPSEPVADMPAGRSWNVGGVEHFNPAADLLGIRWSDDTVSQPGTGFLLGRMERRGWLAGQQLRPDDDLYEVSIGMEPDRVDIADLEIEVEERRDGELVVAERLRLEDTDLREVTRALYEQPPSPFGRPIPAVLLPSLGRAIRRTVRLHHRDGELLDEWQPFNIVESVELSMEINGIRDRT